MFVDATPNGELVNYLRSIEDKNRIAENKRIKFVEKSGIKLINTITPSDPFRSNCHEEQCIACKGNSKFSNCRKSNICYTIKCSNCKSKGINREYIGESNRNLFQRIKEHKDLLEKGKESSVLLKHVMKDHEGEDKKDIEFEAKVVKSFKTPLSRIIYEGVLIAQADENELLNSKKEFFGPAVKRKTIS